jgi:16S rRNA G966 N2-methylase RsmD
MNKRGDKLRRTKDDMNKVFVDPPTAEEYLELHKKYELVLEENDRLRSALIRMHDMYDSYYKKDSED